jgi:hypothetical protein
MVYMPDIVTIPPIALRVPVIYLTMTMPEPPLPPTW